MSPIDLDQDLIHTAPAFQHPVLTALFVLLSAWWVKGPLLITIGLGSDLRSRRLPVAAGAATLAYVVTSQAVTGLKELFDRARPPDTFPKLGSPVAVPESASFPSGHSATAFAAATAIAVLSPKLRWWALGIAASVAISRVYLRVHYPLDILCGALLGAIIGGLAGLLAKRLLAAFARPEA